MNDARCTAAPAPVAAERAQPTTTPAETAGTAPSPNIEVPPAAAADAEVAASTTPTKKKKKKKKANYKQMLAGMMEQSAPRDAEKEKEGIRKATGGGDFAKIDKI